MNSNTSFAAAISSLMLPPPAFSVKLSYWIQLGLSVTAVLIGFPATLAMFLKPSRNQKEFVPCAMLSLWQLVYAFCYIISSATLLSNSSESRTGISAWQCMQFFCNSLIGLASTAYCWSLLLVSIDRLFCIVFLKIYLTRGRLYLQVVRFLPVLGGVINLSAAWIGAAKAPDNPTIHPGMCNYAVAVTANVVFIGSWWGAMPGFFGSVIIYGIAIVIMWSKNHSIFEVVEKQEIARQRKVTLFIGMISTVTLLTNALPTLFNMVIAKWFPALQPTTVTYVTAIKMSDFLFYSLLLWIRPCASRDLILETLRKRFGRKVTTIVAMKHSRTATL